MAETTERERLERLSIFASQDFQAGWRVLLDEIENIQYAMAAGNAGALGEKGNAGFVAGYLSAFSIIRRLPENLLIAADKKNMAAMEKETDKKKKAAEKAALIDEKL